MSDPDSTDKGGAPGLPGVPPGPLRSVVRSLEFSAQLICVSTLLVLFFALFLNVVLRYFFGTGLDWAYDVHVILFPWMIAAGAVLATVHGRHVAITLLRDHASPTFGRLIYLSACLLVAAISAVVVWSTYPIMMAARFQKIAALGGISQLWGYLSITYAFTAIAILSLLDALGASAGNGEVRTDVAQNSLS